MMNNEWRIWRGFLENPIIFFFHSPFSPFHLFFNFPKLLNSYFLSFPSRSALIRVYLRQKNPFLFSIVSFPQLSSSFLFQTAKLLQKKDGLTLMRQVIYFLLFVAFWFGFLNPVAAAEPNSQALAPVVAAIEKILAEKKTPVLVFDLDGTLFDTAQRTVRILHEWAKKNSTNADARIIEKVADKDAAYSTGDTLKNLGITNAETAASVKAFWFKRFFTSEYVVIDAAIPGGPEFTRKCHDKGALIVYLTGRDIPNLGKGTIESLRKNDMPLDEKTAFLMLKPSPEIKDYAFKKDACEKIGKLGVVVAVFENQPRNLNALIGEFPKAIPVFVETNYDLKDTEVPPEKAIRIKAF